MDLLASAENRFWLLLMTPTSLIPASLYCGQKMAKIPVQFKLIKLFLVVGWMFLLMKLSRTMYWNKHLLRKELVLPFTAQLDQFSNIYACWTLYGRSIIISWSGYNLLAYFNGIHNVKNTDVFMRGPFYLLIMVVLEGKSE